MQLKSRSSVYSKYNKKKKKTFTWKRFLFAVLTFTLIYLALFLIVVPERAYKPVLNQDDRPLIISYRGGGSPLAPENTLVAFERSKNLGVDMIHFNVRMSKDGHLVVIHNETVDETTDGEGKVANLTLEELQSLDAAYRFKDIRGNYIYRNQGIVIPTVEQVFKEFSDMRMIIEIQDIESEDEDESPTMVEEKLVELIDRYNMHNKVVLYSASNGVMESLRSIAGDQVAYGASTQEVTRFATLHKLFLNRVYRPQSDVLIIPQNYSIFNLTEQRLIDGAHTLNMSVFYTDVNQERELSTLIDKGANGIMTDRPDMMKRVLSEMGYLE
ncbi:glycerophosphodiester phosphodiesterase [Caldalkalibacillus salinus]|uniref:glycerophosphodiester phosphodiesterase n=1 Tax=Caldalkalibacillus salinus TaxID=2803787 RepID=UPI001924A1FD|nr:glycerophosphodiester phosphodiesterase [Caldalkalibacillus salinus]